MTRPPPTNEELLADLEYAFEQAELFMKDCHPYDQARYIGSLTAELVEAIRLAHNLSVSQKECAAVLVAQIIATIPIVYNRPKKNENATAS